jgi:hypothetical protein
MFGCLCAKAAAVRAEARADKADTDVAPLRAEAAEARAQREAKEEEARVMSDRLAVARLAHKQAMVALKEVGERLGDGSGYPGRAV